MKFIPNNNNTISTNSSCATIISWPSLTSTSSSQFIRSCCWVNPRSTCTCSSATVSTATQTTFTADNLERAFGGVLRHFVLGGHALHDDDDRREVKILTDDERPLVMYDEKTQRSWPAQGASAEED